MAFASWSGVARVMTCVSRACLSPQKKDPPPSSATTTTSAAFRSTRDRLMRGTIQSTGPNSADDRHALSRGAAVKVTQGRPSPWDLLQEAVRRRVDRLVGRGPRGAASRVHVAGLASGYQTRCRQVEREST